MGLKEVPRTNGLTAPWVMAIAAVFGILGSLVPDIATDMRRGDLEAAGFNQEIDSTNVQPTPISEEAAEGFGDWVELKQGILYRAETDGFVVATAHSATGATGVVIRSGSEATKASMQVLARGQDRFDSAVGPVKKGDYWYVTDFDGEGEMLVRWLPLGN